MGLAPFFKYAGGKFKTALSYPPPEHARIVEPFAGGAGYSTRYHDREVALYDSDERVIEAWNYLIAASPADVRSLPILAPGQSLHDHTSLSAGEKAFISFRLNVAAGPRWTATRWPLWTEDVRENLATQVPLIKHWKAYRGDFKQAGGRDLPGFKLATFFIDPPYQQKSFYRDKVADYQQLAEWVHARDFAGHQVIVCEGPGADWLPFRYLREVKAHSNAAASTVAELIWTNDNAAR